MDRLNLVKMHKVIIFISSAIEIILHLEMEDGISEKFSLQPPYAKNHTTWSDPNAKAGDKF